jgi:hypothetical protein
MRKILNNSQIELSSTPRLERRPVDEVNPRPRSDWDGIAKIGRTHMQDATPITLGQEWSGYRHAGGRSGAGVMSATLGTFLKELDPSVTVTMFETLDDCALESSQAWNNAGTGHAANCEMNYTPERADGSVDTRALAVSKDKCIHRGTAYGF